MVEVDHANKLMQFFVSFWNYEAIQALTVPKTREQLRQVIGMINFYRDMWQKRSELLAPLTVLTSKTSNRTLKTSTISVLMLSNV